MGYSETVCQLCGVSFAIARIRTPYEPVEAAWSYTGNGYINQDGRGEIEDTCGELSGCQIIERSGGFGGDHIGSEHLAGPGCACGEGYTGYQISIQEMKGCRAVQCLLKKKEEWTAEIDDRDFELESNYFLTGLGDGSPDEAPLEDIIPARHGVEDLLISNLSDIGYDEWGLPFHPTCFDIFKSVTRKRLGQVDVHGLWEWRNIEGTYETFFENFPRDLAVRNGHQQWWRHEPGTEYLVANPVEVPGLPFFLKSCHREFKHETASMKVPYDVHMGVYHWRYKGPSDPYVQHHNTPPPTSSTSSDPFLKLPFELLYTIIDSLSSKDTATLRVVTRAYRQLPVIFFRKRLLEDMPWLWEARDMPVGQTDWYKLYTMMKGCWQNMKGLKNRKRIWKDVNEIVNRIERYREEGKIFDE